MPFSDTVKRSWNANRLMSVLLELTYACNLDCVFCYNDLSLDGQPLTLAQYIALLDELATLSVLNLTLSGGEPLAHPDFFAIGRHAKERGFVVRIKSNGHALKPSVARRIRDDIDPFMVEVSLHGATAATHDRQTRVAGSFTRLLTNITAMTGIGLRVKANGVLTTWNEHEVEAMMLLCERLGIALQIDTDVKPRDDGDQSPLQLAASAEGLARYNVALEQASSADRAGVAAEVRTLRTGTNKHCGAGSNHLTVDPVGNVLPCVQWRVPVGNLHRSTIADMWAGSETLAEVRQTTTAVREALVTLGPAGELANFCPGAAHAQTGNPLSLYPAVEARLETERARLRLPLL